jgi:hypothetical protein
VNPPFAHGASSSVIAPGNATKSKTTGGSSVPSFTMPDTWKSQNQSADKAEIKK